MVAVVDAVVAVVDAVVAVVAVVDAVVAVVDWVVVVVVVVPTQAGFPTQAKYAAMLASVPLTTLQPLLFILLIVDNHADSLLCEQFLPPTPAAWIPPITTPWQPGQEASASALVAYAAMLAVKPNADTANRAEIIVLLIFIKELLFHILS